MSTSSVQIAMRRILRSNPDAILAVQESQNFVSGPADPNLRRLRTRMCYDVISSGGSVSFWVPIRRRKEIVGFHFDSSARFGVLFFRGYNIVNCHAPHLADSSSVVAKRVFREFWDKAISTAKDKQAQWLGEIEAASHVAKHGAKEPSTQSAPDARKTKSWTRAPSCSKNMKGNQRR